MHNHIYRLLHLIHLGFQTLIDVLNAKSRRCAFLACVSNIKRRKSVPKKLRPSQNLHKRSRGLWVFANPAGEKRGRCEGGRRVETGGSVGDERVALSHVSMRHLADCF